MGDGTSLPIQTFDNSSLSLNSSSFLFHNLLHIPSITKNLVSVLQFCIDNSCYFEFHSIHFFVKDKHTGKLLLTYPTRDGLYIFPSAVPSPSSLFVHVGEKTSINQWHRRLGNPFLALVSRVLHAKYLPFSPTKSSFQCPKCPLAKCHQFSFSSNQAHYTRPLELICADLWGPTHYVS